MSSTCPKVRAPEDGSLTWIKPNIYTDYNRSSIKSHTTNTNPTPPPSQVNPNPNRPTKWTSVLIHQKSHTLRSKPPHKPFLCNEAQILSATELCDGYVYSVVVVKDVPYTGKFQGQKGKRERERTVSEKPRVGRNDRSVVGQAHRGEQHQNKVPTPSRQARAASNSDNALNKGPHRVEGLPHQDLMIKIL
jgi:hypothetical protein